MNAKWLMALVLCTFACAFYAGAVRATDATHVSVKPPPCMSTGPQRNDVCRPLPAATSVGKSTLAGRRKPPPPMCPPGQTPRFLNGQWYCTHMWSTRPATNFVW
jgi:hypothetical protein